MATYSVNAPGAQDVAQELVQATNRLEVSLENLQTAVQRFTQANNGQTLEAYAGAQHQWSQGHSEMRQALILIEQRLLEIVQNYLASDRAGAAFFEG